MYPTVIHEGEVVESPTKRQWTVLGWEPGRTHVSLYDPIRDEYCALKPEMLKHVTSAYSGRTLDQL